jgi:hypothetical protein
MDTTTTVEVTLTHTITVELNEDEQKEVVLWRGRSMRVERLTIEPDRVDGICVTIAGPTFTTKGRKPREEIDWWHYSGFRWDDLRDGYEGGNPEQWITDLCLNIVHVAL